jgi:hypothetical protein
MEYNYSVWDYYQPDFVDPGYAPYIRAPVKDEYGNVVMTNTWDRIPCPNGLVNPALFRKDWGLRFALLHPDDPCPPGFEKTADSYCIRKPLDYEPIMYTEKAFVPRNQYWSGYTSRNNVPRDGSDQFDMRSVNPLTGMYTVYYRSNPPPNSGAYGRCPSKESYLV